MMLARRGRFLVPLAATAVVIFLFQWTSVKSRFLEYGSSASHFVPPPDDDFVWRKMEHNYPVTSFRPLPTPSKHQLPRVQANFGPESAEQRKMRETRKHIVKDAFVRCWSSYKQLAWLHDEVTPITGRPKDTFGGWGATLIDSLDVLWMMDLKEEFETAVEAVHEHVFFNTTEPGEINVFETTIRFLGGLLAAYDFSEDHRLLSKARDVGDMLYKAFDTPNRLPVTRWDLHEAAGGTPQAASGGALLAEIGSLSMEFTRLSLVTGDPKYYDAVQHVSELFAESQQKTKLPGMWPIVVDAANSNFDAGSDYSLGGMADSMFEYLPKMMALVGESGGLYQAMYEQSMAAVVEHLLYRPMTPSADDVLFPGVVHAEDGDEGPTYRLETSGGHLGCFTGGMFALGGRLVASTDHLNMAERLTEGCVWAYNATSTGVMPEVLHFAACPGLDACAWSKEAWHAGIASRQGAEASEAAKVAEDQRLPLGVTKISDARYILRPEAVESVFYMYRVTGDERWRDEAWHLWEAIGRLTKTDLANSAVGNVHPGPGQDAGPSDSMESFWLGETLKYFYLLFSEPSLLSLDEWVFNTEAHPFKRLR